MVAPFVGAWIEIDKKYVYRKGNDRSLRSSERGLKYNKKA